MNRKSILSGRCASAALALALGMLQSGAHAQAVDLGMTDRIVDEGQRRSEVMAIAQYLSDEIGGRLTNSPAARKAEAWTQERFRGWGLWNVRKEGFFFGRGWWMERSSVRMVTPRPLALNAIPISWTPPTNGTITAPIVFAPMRTRADLAQWKGKLAGKIVLISPTDGVMTLPAASRLSADEFARMEKYEPPKFASDSAAMLDRSYFFPRQTEDFLKAEGALAYARITKRDGKIVMGDGYRYAPGDESPLPGVEIAAEDYRRLARFADAGREPTLAIESVVHYDDSDPQAYNIFAEIPGSDPKAAYVMAGAHLDSSPAADGAADDGAGVAMVMEAARILSKMPRPHRTIRFALWGAEEQGMIGSSAYVEQRLGKRVLPTEPKVTSNGRFWFQSSSWPIVLRPTWNELSVYFNLDNGSGKIRGIYAQRNMAAMPIFREWLAPFASMGATMVAASESTGDDNEYMQLIGVPGFQFIQDWNDYGRMHHTSMDTFDHLDPDDMRQASIILASFLWNAANMDKRFPRRPMPTEPGGPGRENDPGS
ncbi:M20/M25/M40 family metallo-hydrolase [Sphingomonas sp. JC676]|nr:M20/M25/M40 family metallo-hydrolase [Sphingomonas sp. JC676]